METTTENIIQRSSERKYLVRFKLTTSREEKVYDFTPLIELVQYEGMSLVSKVLREIHHNYASLNIQELTRDLKKEYIIADYSESVPLELYFLKELADRLDAIKEMPMND